MCGICGIVHFNQKPVVEEDIRLMMSKIKHRGPDDEGTFIDNNIGLGFVRLSILDLSQAGHQPMFSQDGRYVIVCNGEVYNYVELRHELRSKYQFKTGTDTEVILSAYQEWGPNCLHKFNGMFAIAIYDKKTKDLFFARDRFGIKPFYYFNDGESFIFASEIKAILPFIKNREPNERIIADYLLYNKTDHTTNTFFKNINKLNHGSYFYINGENLTETRWYDLDTKVSDNRIVSLSEYRKLFYDSLKLRLTFHLRPDRLRLL